MKIEQKQSKLTEFLDLITAGKVLISDVYVVSTHSVLYSVRWFSTHKFSNKYMHILKQKPGFVLHDFVSKWKPSKYGSEQCLQLKPILK